MGIVIRMALHHMRAPSRAARWAKRSDVRPAKEAFSVDKIRVHHSDGILSRFHHLITAQFPAPTSEAIASRESQSSMMERNESKSRMPKSMGPIVPKIKAIMSHDCISAVGHDVPMSQDDENIAESAWRAAFTHRLRAIQGSRTQEDMADLLGISRDSWNKMVNRGSAVPTRLLPKLAKIGAMSLEWLIEGDRGEKKTPIRKPDITKRKAS